MLRGVHLALGRAEPEARFRNAVFLAGLVLWMLYTRLFWSAKAVHATLPACPFLALTGHPCPFCGGTRSFAYMWQGDVGRASALYPLGPLLFCATLAAIPALVLVVAFDGDLVVRLSTRWKRALAAAVGGVLGISWILKLTILPN